MLLSGKTLNEPVCIVPVFLNYCFKVHSFSSIVHSFLEHFCSLTFENFSISYLTKICESLQHIRNCYLSSFRKFLTVICHPNTPVLCWCFLRYSFPLNRHQHLFISPMLYQHCSIPPSTAYHCQCTTVFDYLLNSPDALQASFHPSIDSLSCLMYPTISDHLSSSLILQTVLRFSLEWLSWPIWATIFGSTDSGRIPGLAIIHHRTFLFTVYCEMYLVFQRSGSMIFKRSWSAPISP